MFGASNVIHMVVFCIAVFSKVTVFQMQIISIEKS